MKKMKSNLPYYEKMAEKLQKEVDAYTQMAVDKKAELELVNNTIASLKELEGVSK